MAALKYKPQLHSLGLSMFRSLDFVSTVCLILFGGVFTAIPFGSAAGQDAELAFEQQVEKVTQQISQSMVGLESIGGSGRIDAAKKSRGPGTGVVVGKEGWVLTAAYHVADNPTSIVATLPSGNRVPAEIVATDNARNVVLLKLRTKKTLKVPTKIGRNQLKIGQSMIAIGKGFDVNSVQVSTGVLSAVNRVWGKAIQTDAKVSPANYGGPLVDLEGRVAGLLVPLSPRGDKVMDGSDWYDSGIGFAVPLDELLERLPELKKGQDQFAGKLGVAFRGTDIYVDDCEVAFCTGSSPAGKAGIRPGDLIVSVNGQPTPRQATFKHAIGAAYAGDTLKITIQRSGETKAMEAVLAAQLPAYAPVGIGIALTPVDPANQAERMVVRQVQAGGPAEVAGIQIGDKIVLANGLEVSKPNDLLAQIAATAQGDAIDLVVDREEQQIEVQTVVQSRGSRVPEPDQDTSDETAIKAFELKIAEAPNDCFVIAPATKATDNVGPLLVWLAEPGELDFEAIKAKWSAACESNKATVLVVGSADANKWSPEESTVVMQAIATLNKSEPFDRGRVVVGGTGAGGTMASLVCFGQPRAFQGLVLDAATASRQLPEVKTNPIAPMMVLVSDGDDPSALDQSLQTIRESKTPIQRVPAVTPDETLRWASFVDRL